MGQWKPTRRELLATAALAVPGLRAEPKKLRIGIVGGRFGATFQWALHPDCVVTAVCDTDTRALKRLAEVYRCGTEFPDFREMLRHPGLDAVAIFTPAPLHAAMTVEAMKAGKHVISAVPIGLTVEDLEEVLGAVKASGLRYMMAETSYYRPEIIHCRELAAQGAFGTIFYAESEYHHEGLVKLMYDDAGKPTWRLGLPPMLYPTHCTGMLIPVMRERLAEVTAIGWGDGHEALKRNPYKNPFWNETAFFKTAKGHAARVSICWHAAVGEAERGQFLGDRMSYFMERPEGAPDTIIRIASNGNTELDSNGYPKGEIEITRPVPETYLERLPEPMRVKSGHGGSHTFLTHEFVDAVLGDRDPSVDVYEAIAYTLPGIMAHASAMRGGAAMKIRDYGKASS